MVSKEMKKVVHFDFANVTEASEYMLRSLNEYRATGNTKVLHGIESTLTGKHTTIALSALSNVVSLLDSTVSDLVQHILNVDEWLYTTNVDLFKAYSNLLQNIVSAHPFYVLPIVRMLITSLRPHPTSSKKPYTERTRHSNRIHCILQPVLCLIPSGPSFLLSILTENFPYKTEDKFTHTEYVENILKLTEYSPNIHSGVIGLIVDRILQIDVEIQVEIEDLNDESSAATTLDGNLSDATDAPNNVNSTSTFAAVAARSTILANNTADVVDDDDGGDEDDETTMISTDIASMVQKVDSLLNILFTHVQSVYTGELGHVSIEDVFETLLNVFQRSVLPTHQTRFTQFLWVYLCSLDATFADVFLGVLVQKTFDPCAPVVLRLKAVGYLASFIARTKYVEADSVSNCIKLLCGWASQYIDNNDHMTPSSSAYSNTTNTKKNTRTDSYHDTTYQKQQHAIFYAAVQAVLYIWCFRWRDLVDPNDMSQIPLVLKLFPRIIQSGLEPLRNGCAHSVSGEAANIMHKLQMMYLHPFIGDGEKQKPVVSSFFPFDPSGDGLPSCWNRFIEDVYVSYVGLNEELPDTIVGFDDHVDMDFEFE